MVEMIGRWSMELGQREASTLHVMNGDGESEHLQTLSGWVQFPVLHASSMSVLRGKVISRCMFMIRSNRGFSNLSLLVRWPLCGASHALWCRLKSPRMISLVVGSLIHVSLFDSHSFARVLIVWL